MEWSNNLHRTDVKQTTSEHRKCEKHFFLTSLLSSFTANGGFSVKRKESLSDKLSLSLAAGLNKESELCTALIHTDLNAEFTVKSSPIMGLLQCSQAFLDYFQWNLQVKAPPILYDWNSVSLMWFKKVYINLKKKKKSEEMLYSTMHCKKFTLAVWMLKIKMLPPRCSTDSWWTPSWMCTSCHPPPPHTPRGPCSDLLAGEPQPL